MRNWLAILLGIVVFAGTPGTLFAHAMKLKIEVTATELRVEVRYEGADHGGGGPTITLWHLPEKTLTAKFPTNDQGICVFPKPPAGKYLVEAEDEFHSESKEIVVSDVAQLYEDAPVNKWWMIGIGLLVIGALTAAGWYISRPAPPPAPTA